MKAHLFTFTLFLLGFGWINIGCYTQMQLTYDSDRPTQVKRKWILFLG